MASILKLHRSRSLLIVAGCSFRALVNEPRAGIRDGPSGRLTPNGSGIVDLKRSAQAHLARPRHLIMHALADARRRQDRERKAPRDLADITDDFDVAEAEQRDEHRWNEDRDHAPG